MVQQRDAPAYQEYAASMMARTEYRLMSLEGRGLLLSLRHECWVNMSMPADPSMLARVLGFPVEQIERALPEVMPFFKRDGSEIRCPELDDYRDHLHDRRQRQAEGGRRGAAKTNRAHATGNLAGKPAGKPRVAREVVVKNSRVQNSQSKGLERRPSNDEWISDYEDESRGR